MGIVETDVRVVDTVDVTVVVAPVAEAYRKAKAPATTMRITMITTATPENPLLFEIKSGSVMQPLAYRYIWVAANGVEASQSPPTLSKRIFHGGAKTNP